MAKENVLKILKIMKLILSSYVCIFFVLLIAISTSNLSKDFKQAFGIVTLVLCFITVPVLFISMSRLIFYSNKDWLEKSAEKIKEESYPGIPLAVSGNQETAMELRNLVTNTFIYGLGSVIFQIMIFYFLTIF